MQQIWHIMNINKPNFSPGCPLLFCFLNPPLEESSTARSAEATIQHVQSISVAFEPAGEEMMFVDSKSRHATSELTKIVY